MSPDRADELSYGDERSAPLWPRGWLVITALVAGAALAAGLQLGRRGVQRDSSGGPPLPSAPVTATVTATATATVTPPAAATATASPSPAPAPTALTGPSLDHDIDGEVIIGGREAALLDLGSRRYRRITGLRAGERLETAVQTAAGTVLLTYSGDAVDGRPASLYLLPPRSTAATRLSAGAAWTMRGGTPRTFWTWREGPPASANGALSQTGEERRADGSVVRRVTLPPGSHVVQVTGDHLLLFAGDDTEPARLTLWDPATGKAVLRLPPSVQPAATSPTAVAWIGPSCFRDTVCTLHVTSLPDGADSVLELGVPDGASFHGTFNARSDAIAAVVAEGGYDGGAPRQQAYVLSATSGATIRIEDGEFPESGWVVGWTPDDAAAVFASGQGPGLRQLAVWRRAGGSLEVVGDMRPGAQALAVRPG